MIVRTWHGCVPSIYAEAFSRHLDATGVAHARAVEGNLGAFVRMETQDNLTHFFLTTYWVSWDAIKEFAGDTYERAVAYQDDERFSLISDPLVLHHEVSQIVPLNS